MNLFDEFNRVKSKDSIYVKKYLTEWKYQITNKARKLNLPKESVGDYENYSGKEDLINWMKWISQPIPNRIDNAYFEELIEKSIVRDKEILSKIKIDYDFNNYKESIGVFNSFDYYFPNCYPTLKERKIKKVIDFGSGYGRQANLWTVDSENQLVSIEGIAKSYTLQNLYYNNINATFKDYIEHHNNFEFDENTQIIHIPTWRFDLLPDNYFDLVICVQVLPELTSKLVKSTIKTFSKKLKTGGMLYINDHAEKWKPGSNLNIDKFIKENGFVLEFQPHLGDSRDMHGQIRIYRKIDPEIIKLNNSNFKIKYRQFYSDIDTFLGGRITKLVKIKKRLFNK
jgi:2-polyprenyl-3-methyl-5-hydroxy-6-metoxy-1,4-benzoquinol methylase